MMNKVLISCSCVGCAKLARELGLGDSLSAYVNEPMALAIGKNTHRVIELAHTPIFTNAPSFALTGIVRA